MEIQFKRYSEKAIVPLKAIHKDQLDVIFDQVHMN